MKPLKKFVVLGPESTGKSTLCERLAHHFNTLWCNEFAREYLTTIKREYGYEDLKTIANGQIESEEKLILLSNKLAKELLFVDTGMYVMKVWCEFVFGKCHKYILDTIAERKYEGYLLCYPDLPWVADPLREYPDEKVRQKLFRHYYEIMANQNVPWCVISGSYEQRTQKAISFVDQVSGF